MTYVPPHLRSNQSYASANRYTLDDISALLGRSKSELSTLTTTSPHPDETTEGYERIFNEDKLHAIILFTGQHPEWKSDRKILCKSNLHVLRNHVGNSMIREDSSTVQTLSIHDSAVDYPLFEEIPFMQRKFDFAGWWRIRDITFLAPRSAELVALFEKKFSSQNGRSRNTSISHQRGQPKMRTPQAWHDSLDREWAVVSLVRNQQRKDRPEVSVNQSSSSGHMPSDNSPHAEANSAARNDD